MPRLVLAWMAALALLGLLIAGCGDGNTTVTETQSGVTETSGTEATGTGTTGTGAPIASAASAHALPPEVHPGKHGPHYFETPSHNIGCYLSNDSVRCDIRERTWSPPPEPKSCIKFGVDWGQGIGVGVKNAQFVCAGDTVLGGPQQLPYGSYAVRGSVGCFSQRAGIVCQNIDTRHGFFLSRQSYRIF